MDDCFETGCLHEIASSSEALRPPLALVKSIAVLGSHVTRICEEIGTSVAVHSPKTQDLEHPRPGNIGI